MADVAGIDVDYLHLAVVDLVGLSVVAEPVCSVIFKCVQFSFLFWVMVFTSGYGWVLK